MPRRIYLPVDVAEDFEVVRVGDRCYKRVGPSPLPPDTLEISAAFTSCEECEGGSSSSSYSSGQSSDSQPSSSSSGGPCDCPSQVIISACGQSQPVSGTNGVYTATFWGCLPDCPPGGCPVDYRRIDITATCTEVGDVRYLYIQAVYSCSPPDIEPILYGGGGCGPSPWPCNVECFNCEFDILIVPSMPPIYCPFEVTVCEVG